MWLQLAPANPKTPSVGAPKLVQEQEQPREEDSGITLGTGPAAEGRERYKSRLKLYGQNLQAMNHSPLALPQYYLEIEWSSRPKLSWTPWRHFHKQLPPPKLSCGRKVSARILRAGSRAITAASTHKPGLTAYQFKLEAVDHYCLYGAFLKRQHISYSLLSSGACLVSGCALTQLSFWHAHPFKC